MRCDQAAEWNVSNFVELRAIVAGFNPWRNIAAVVIEDADSAIERSECHCLNCLRMSVIELHPRFTSLLRRRKFKRDCIHIAIGQRRDVGVIPRSR